MLNACTSAKAAQKDNTNGFNQTRLFKKFQQAGEDMLARDVNQSTGLGLYISKLLVTAMGGTIALEKSELGKGSTFVFMLPTKAPKA
jgi:signal transduction histidine kinase